jgi:hypothetical protein
VYSLGVAVVLVPRAVGRVVNDTRAISWGCPPLTTELAARIVTASAAMLLAPRLSEVILASWVTICIADAVVDVDGTFAGAKPTKVATGGPGTA